MATIVVSYNLLSVAAGARCRLYRRADNSYLGEALADGIGPLSFAVARTAIDDFVIVAVHDLNDTREVVPTQFTMTL